MLFHSFSVIQQCEFVLSTACPFGPQFLREVYSEQQSHHLYLSKLTQLSSSTLSPFSLLPPLHFEFQKVKVVFWTFLIHLLLFEEPVIYHATVFHIRVYL